MRAGESQRFDYIGGIEAFVVPVSGIYQLDVYGARGGYYWQQGNTQGAKGGYAKGFITLKKGTVLYICAGGVGANSRGGDTTGHDTDQTAGGYNGGGKGNNSGSGGGGATHIALVTGTLSQIGFDEFVTQKKGLIVAPGGGGEGGYEKNKSTNNVFMGGNGGGLTGLSHGTSTSGNLGGTQTSGAAFGQGANAKENPTVYRYNYHCGGGGGGLYGGNVASDNHGAGGGSAYIGGVPAFKGYNPSTESGVNNGNGYATITLIKKNGGIRIGDAEYEIRLGDSEVEKRIGDMEVGA